MGEMTMHQVELELTSHEPLAQDVLEDLAEAIYDGLVERCKLVVLGPAVSVNLKSSTVEVLFDVQAESDADIYTKIAAAISALEASPLAVQSSRTIEAQHAERDCVPA